MSSLAEKKKIAVSFWEKRRLVYNLMLVPAAFLGWGIYGAVSAGVDDQARMGTVGVLLLFLLSALGANICYSTVYALEFIFFSNADDSFWTRRGRTLVFFAGCAFAFGLAIVGGRNIAVLQYSMVR